MAAGFFLFVSPWFLLFIFTFTFFFFIGPVLSSFQRHFHSEMVAILYFT
jgi:hypothetical protein